MVNEIKKNIETCRGEDVLAEVSGLPQDPHFGSLVNEAFDPMQQQALHQAGYDGYSEVIEQNKPYTFASAIIQMKSNLLLLLRALWQFPFGSGTLRSLSDDASLRSLSDMWQHYITRLSGNETYGIPSRLSSLTDLPSAPLLLADRKISGVPEAEDGISLVHLLCDPASITELTDDNKGWTIDTVLNSTSMFPSCEKVTLGCEKADFVNFGYNGGSLLNADCEYYLPNLKKIVPKPTGVGWPQTLIRGTQTHDVDCPELEEITAGDWFGFCGSSAGVATTPFTINLPKLSICPTPLFRPYDAECTCGVSKIVLGKIETNNFNPIGYFRGYYALPNLIHLEFGADTAVSLNLSGWNPSYVLSDNPTGTDLIEEGSTAINNLEEFLSNFRTYIALRLTDNGSGKTLTLSAAVFSSIWDANGNPQVLQDGLDQLRADIHNIVKTTKHWDVNKAN